MKGHNQRRQGHSQAPRMFSSGDALLEVALGLKEGAAVQAIASWVDKPPRKVRPATKVSRSKIVQVAKKLNALLEKFRRTLKPVFAVRTKVQELIGAAGLLAMGLQSIDTLFEFLEDPAARVSGNFRLLSEQVSNELSDALKPKFAGARALLKDAGTKFLDSDFVTFNDIAAAVIVALQFAVPKQFKVPVKRAMQTGLAQDLATRVVAPMIPPAVVDGINSAIRSVAAKAEPTIEKAQGTFDNILEGLENSLVEQLPKVIAQLSERQGHAGERRGEPVHKQLKDSQGQRLDETTQEQISADLGLEAGNVWIHRDVAANRAADALGANALTIGRHIYFGEGRFAPESPGGRTLLAHEMVHVVQQSEAGFPLLQLDWKDLVDRLAKRFSQKVIAEIKGARAPSKAKLDKAEAIKKRVSKLIGRKVVNERNPALPKDGDSYVTRKGRIVNIRRKPSMAAFIPALTIDKKNRRIKLAALLNAFDPKAAARARLRRAMGCKPNQEAHHVIPLDLQSDPVVQLAVKNGFNFNSAQNGACISGKTHQNHPIYTENVRRALITLRTKHGSSWPSMQTDFFKLVSGFREQAKRARGKLR